MPDGNFLFAEVAEQRFARFVVADDTHGDDPRPQVRQVIHSVRTTPGRHLLLALFQDQHRRFARDAGDFTVDGLIGHQVAQHHHFLAAESVQNGEQGTTVWARKIHPFGSWGAVTTRGERAWKSSRIMLTAASRFPATRRHCGAGFAPGLHGQAGCSCVIFHCFTSSRVARKTSSTATPRRHRKSMGH